MEKARCKCWRGLSVDFANCSIEMDTSGPSKRSSEQLWYLCTSVHGVSLLLQSSVASAAVLFVVGAAVAGAGVGGCGSLKGTSLLAAFCACDESDALNWRNMPCFSFLSLLFPM